MQIVSVTDGNMVNVNAALVLYHNLFDVCAPDADVFLLTYRNQLPESYIEYYRHLGVEVIFYDMPAHIMRDDPYRIKYLLHYFVDGLSSDESVVFYLDPDHIIQKELVFCGTEPENGSVFVSSEIKSYERGNAGDRRSNRHLNTSMMLAARGVLRSVFTDWLREYELLRDDVGVRYREEIAMVIAAEKHRVPVQPCDTGFQCTIDAYRRDSVLCHYGGQSQAVGEIKSMLNGSDYKRMTEAFRTCGFYGNEGGRGVVVACIERYLHKIYADLG